MYKRNSFQHIMVSNFEQRIRKFLFSKGLIKHQKYQDPEFTEHNFRFGVHLEVSSDNPYNCVEIYSESSNLKPNPVYWSGVKKTWEKAFKESKPEMKTAFGKTPPKLNVDLFIVDYSKIKTNDPEYEMGSDDGSIN